MSAETLSATLQRRDGRAVVPSGVELVELSERFYRGLFVGMVVFVGLSAVAALALLPLRQSVHTGGPPVTVVMTALIAAVTPFAVWRASVLYRALRRSRVLELAVVAVAAALVAYPLRSELWWPSCALIMLLAILAPLHRTLAYCLIVLLANLASHVIAGDLEDTPTVAILGLWVGFPFWSSTVSVVGDRFAAHVLRMQTSPPSRRPDPLRVHVWVTEDTEPSVTDADDPKPAGASAPSPAPGIAGVMGRLTARQLQVTALLVDGLRYREVAACLSITERQVQRHVSNAITRAGVRTANELVAIGVAEGLAPIRERPVWHLNTPVPDTP